MVHSYIRLTHRSKKTRTLTRQIRKDVDENPYLLNTYYSRREYETFKTLRVKVDGVAPGHINESHLEKAIRDFEDKEEKKEHLDYQRRLMLTNQNYSGFKY